MTHWMLWAALQLNITTSALKGPVCPGGRQEPERPVRLIRADSPPATSAGFCEQSGGQAELKGLEHAANIGIATFFAMPPAASLGTPSTLFD
jgi:hypothetical protein